MERGVARNMRILSSNMDNNDEKLPNTVGERQDALAVGFRAMSSL